MGAAVQLYKPLNDVFLAAPMQILQKHLTAYTHATTVPHRPMYRSATLDTVQSPSLDMSPSPSLGQGSGHLYGFPFSR